MFCKNLVGKFLPFSLVLATCSEHNSTLSSARWQSAKQFVCELMVGFGSLQCPFHTTSIYIYICSTVSKPFTGINTSSENGA